MSWTLIFLLPGVVVGLVLALAALWNEIEDTAGPRRSPARHSWESTQGETTRLDDRPAKLVHLEEDQAVWRLDE